YAACAALRLARFNTQVGAVDKRWFIGLASPAAAALVVSFVWAMNSFGYAGQALRWEALVVTVAAGLLMVSRSRYFSFKGFPKGGRVPFSVLSMGVVALAVRFIAQAGGLFAFALLYALSGPVWWAWTRIRHKCAA